PSVLGHYKGTEVILDIVNAAAKLGVKVITLYAFSTENWNRSNEEVDALMELFESYLSKQKNRLVKEGVRFSTIGDLEKFPKSLQKIVDNLQKATENGKSIELVLALNYGGRDEIRRGVIKILEDYDEKKLCKSQMTEELISRYLDTHRYKDPDLMIRTSGEKRLSNFLLWQLAYAELYMTDIYWPDFTKEELYKAVESFQSRSRRRGK
nr:polyprenyl diphosphate synthase [Chlamydiales bacterium]